MLVWTLCGRQKFDIFCSKFRIVFIIQQIKIQRLLFQATVFIFKEYLYYANKKVYFRKLQRTGKSDQINDKIFELKYGGNRAHRDSFGVHMKLQILKKIGEFLIPLFNLTVSTSPLNTEYICLGHRNLPNVKTERTFSFL